MQRTHMIAAVSLIALAGCNLIGKGTARLGGPSKASGAPGAAGVPQVVADDSDPPRVRNALAELDAMEQLIAARDWARYARESTDFQQRSLFGQNWANEKKGPAIQARIDGLDTAAYKAFGGRLAAIGDGARVREGVSPDTAEVIGEMLDACDTAAESRGSDASELAKNLAAAIGTYEKQLARVQKLDPKALRYFGEINRRRGTEDVPTELLRCEAKLAAMEGDLAESYRPEVASGEAAVEVGCGVIYWLADGVRVGSNKFAPYRRTAGGNSYAEKVACSKIPKRDKVPGALAEATREFRRHIAYKDMVIVVDGPPYVEVSDNDYLAHRYQKLRAYSKTFKLASNPCGELQVFCEAGGSKGATAYNRVEFALERAAAHAGKKPDLCRSHLKNVRQAADWFAEFHAEGVKNKTWIGGATYRTKKGQKLKEADFIAAFAKHGKLAEERIDNGYCAKPAT